MSYDTLAYNVTYQTVKGPALALIQFSQAVPSGQVWRVTQITVASTVSPRPEALIYDQNLPLVGKVLSPDWTICTPVPAQGTLRGDLDFDDQSSPLTIPGGSVVSILWLENGGGAPLELGAGDICGCRLQWEVCQLSASQAKAVLT